MKKLSFSLLALSALWAGLTAPAWAAPDWSKVPKREIAVFHPGVAPIEWLTNIGNHSGVGGLGKGETCVNCHEEKGGLNFDFKRIARDMEPKGAPRTMSFPVAVQAAYDKDNLYIRLNFKAPAGGADKGDRDNELKATLLFPSDKVPMGRQVGCWQACHDNARTMPGASDKKTKYTKAGAYELMQWRSTGQVSDGSVTNQRKMTGGSTGVKAEGARNGDAWTVTFTRKNPGEGKSVPFGLAIHADNAAGRFHHVSLGYTLGIGAPGDVSAVRQ